MEPATTHILNDQSELCSLLGPELAKQPGTPNMASPLRASNAAWCPRDPRHGPDKSGGAGSGGLPDGCGGHVSSSDSRSSRRGIDLRQHTDYDTLFQQHSANLAIDAPVHVYVAEISQEPRNFKRVEFGIVHYE